jgi:cellulose synthase (UDP-forming)
MAAPSGLKVDVFIPTYNESPEMVRRTALAATRIRNAHETWILDDGNRPEVRRIAEEMGCRYIARAHNIHAKPGNLNNALKYATGDFVAIMDADYVAQRNFLDRTLGYFSDPKVALVQCPQDYYNISAFQYRTGNRERFLWHDEATFYQVLEPGRDYWNAASSCGTACVYRRSAIDAIGGFAPETVTEDLHTAIRLQRRGYDTVYHPEPLAFGVAPTDFAEYQKTRHRWGQGNIQGLRCERVPFSRGLTFMQRLCYLQFGVLYLEGWQRLILYLTPVVVLIGNVYPVGDTRTFFWLFIPYLVLDYLCYEEMTRGYGRVYLNEQLCMARFPIYILATFALFFNYVRWRVSSKKIAGDLPISLILPQLAILALNLVALGFGVWRIASEPDGDVPKWVTAFVCGFAALYVLLAALVIREARRCASHKRPDFRFTVPLPVALDGGAGGPMLGVVETISAAGMSFVPARPIACPAGTTLSGRVFLPGGALRFRAIAEAPQRTGAAAATAQAIACSLSWERPGDRDRLDLALHSCGWHRRFVNCGDYLPTVLELIEQRLLRRPPSVPAPVPWIPVLYRRAATAAAGDWRFALVFDPAQDRGELLCFESVAPGTRLALLDPAGSNALPAAIAVVTLAEAEAPEESGLDDARAFRYATRVAATFAPTVLPSAPTFASMD